ncbi:ROK family transcriptional regulator [Oceanicella actignis]|uniref:Sugar kinase of the NBD/HSP70 family, may contain an N-terminal HTH domain n=1 Tax=Oceanicella actignis TaxID=1189325 RepID=A0A1M7TCI1_9RHOB|nr:ROK family transcriptional regulator [Oceanicella actignis]SET55399.1 Sugar kinase of the NBD/HSP70 family, may contain an N-terminal HTH domain [Oceanicella actignis]SHN68432.1 Sugar kinase of the NBD/HSP70 family, may contain an N-terminal HTH domain [Oceanicella actignis]
MRASDPAGLRAYNERVIINALLRRGPMSKAEIARETGLSGQAASVIVNALLAEGLLRKLEKVRGQVGQPSTPVAPNPSGAYALGVKIGRRSVEAALIDLTGAVVAHRHAPHAAPLPETCVAAAAALGRACLDALDEEGRARVVGMGLAMPGDMHAWPREMGLPPGALDGWRGFDAGAALQEALGMAPIVCNDATAACAAEMLLGSGIASRSALYIYLGMFAGGGVVIDGRLVMGEQGNAGAIGSMPVGAPDARGRPQQLAHRAGLISLERALREAGLDAGAAMQGAPPEAEQDFRRWVRQVAPELALAVAAALSVIDFPTIVVDGALPAPWRARLAAATAREMGALNRAGLSPAVFAVGALGHTARVLGAASLPLQRRFSPDPELVARAG